MPICAGFGRICARWQSIFCRKYPCSGRGVKQFPRPWETAFSGPRSSLPTRWEPGRTARARAPLPTLLTPPARIPPDGDGYDIFCNNPALK